MLLVPVSQATPAPGSSRVTPAPAGAAPAPAARTPAAPPAPSDALGLIRSVPGSREDVRSLRAQRSELSDQLQSAVGRREDLAKELQGATGASRAGIESRLQLLDARILQIEGDIASTGELLARAPGQYLTGSSQSFPGNFPVRPDMTAISIVFTIFVLMPLAVSYARTMWRRGSVSKVESPLERENAERLVRLEQAVDSIAIETERISEGQRFVTKLLAETQGRDKVRIEAPRD